MAETDRSLDAWRDELNSAALYDALGSLETNPKLAEIYRRLAAEERRHAETWTAHLRAAAATVPTFQPSWRTRVLIGLARRFGIGLILPSLASLEDIGGHGYVQTGGADADGMAVRERSHARLLRRITRTTGGLEGRRSPNLRAATGRPGETRCARPCSAPTTAWSPTSAW
jgi:hypothetical protein